MPVLRALMGGKFLEPTELCPDRNPRRVRIRDVQMGEAKISGTKQEVDFFLLIDQSSKPIRLKPKLYDQIAAQHGDNTDNWIGQEIALMPVAVQVYDGFRDFFAVPSPPFDVYPKAEPTNIMRELANLNLPRYGDSRNRALPPARPQGSGTFNPQAAVKTISPETAQRFWNQCNTHKTGPQTFIPWAKKHDAAAYAVLVAHFKGENAIQIDPTRWPHNKILYDAMKKFMDNLAKKAQHDAAPENVDTATGEVIDITEDEIPF